MLNAALILIICLMVPALGGLAHDWARMRRQLRMLSGKVVYLRDDKTGRICHKVRVL